MKMLFYALLVAYFLCFALAYCFRWEFASSATSVLAMMFYPLFCIYFYFKSEYKLVRLCLFLLFLSVFFQHLLEKV